MDSEERTEIKHLRMGASCTAPGWGRAQVGGDLRDDPAAPAWALWSPAEAPSTGRVVISWDWNALCSTPIRSAWLEAHRQLG
jgi:hypothetical protein